MHKEDTAMQCQGHGYTVGTRHCRVLILESSHWGHRIPGHHIGGTAFGASHWGHGIRGVTLGGTALGASRWGARHWGHGNADVPTGGGLKRGDSEDTAMHKEDTAMQCQGHGYTVGTRHCRVLILESSHWGHGIRGVTLGGTAFGASRWGASHSGASHPGHRIRDVTLGGTALGTRQCRCPYGWGFEGRRVFF
jgi:hypothetical protein